MKLIIIECIEDCEEEEEEEANVTLVNSSCVDRSLCTCWMMRVREVLAVELARCRICCILFFLIVGSFD